MQQATALLGASDSSTLIAVRFASLYLITVTCRAIFASQPNMCIQGICCASALEQLALREQDETGSAPPWAFGFHCNERHLQWDDSAQRQLIKIHVAEKLNKVSRPPCGRHDGAA